MPPFSLFKKADYFYSTLAHEAVHYSGHPSRCNRQLGNRFGSEATPPRSSSLYLDSTAFFIRRWLLELFPVPE